MSHRVGEVGDRLVRDALAHGDLDDVNVDGDRERPDGRGILGVGVVLRDGGNPISHMRACSHA